MNIKDLLCRIDEIVPFNLSETWDNTGLVIGDNEMLVSKICLTLDATPEVIDHAADSKCNVIISHHPLIFTPVKTIDTSTITGTAIKKAMKNDIAIISLHTNWDKSGLNNTLAAALNLVNIRTLQPKKNEECRIGVVGELPQEENLEDFLRILKNAWNLSHVICHETKNQKTVSKVAICGGSGGEFWLDALSENADVFITSEAKRHQCLAANYKGMYIIETNHYEMESFSLLNLKILLEKMLEIDIEIINPYVSINVLAR
jgi:dinuclear metal center YbgI/SA1388 family protein